MMGKKSFEGKWLGFCDGMFHRFWRFLERCAQRSILRPKWKFKSLIMMFVI